MFRDADPLSFPVTGAWSAYVVDQGWDEFSD